MGILLSEVAASIKAGQSAPGVILATHNATSITKALNQLVDARMAKKEEDHLEVDPRLRGTLIFAQLLGAWFCSNRLRLD